MAKVLRIKSAAELREAIKTLNGDTTLVLEQGNYGSINMNIKNPSMVSKDLASSSKLTIQSADSDKPAVFEGLFVNGAKNVVLDGLTFDHDAAPRDSVALKPFRFESSENMEVRNSTFVGDDASGFGDYRDGYGSGTGFFIRGSKNVIIEDNTFENFETGLAVADSSNTKILGNEFTKMSSDGIQMTKVTKVLIEDNYIHDFDAASNTRAHMDMIQIWAIKGGQASNDVTIRSNILDSGSGNPTQSIFIFNNFGSSPFRDFLVEDNVVRNAHKHGITFNHTQNILIKRNTLVQNEDAAEDTTELYVPIINLWQNVRNATVERNVVHRIDDTSGRAKTIANVIIQRDAATKDGYYDDLFLNGFADSNGTWMDIQSAPGSVLQQKALGASALYFDTTPEEITPLLLFEAGEELQMGEFEFDASNVYGPSGKVSTSGATAVWDFGDGSRGTGLDVRHTYDKSGIYEVKGTLTLRDGTKLNLQKTVETESPAALRTDLSKRGQDISGEPTPTKVEGGVRFVKDGGSDAALFSKGGRLRYDTSDEFYDNTAFTLLLDYRKDQVSDIGKVISFFGTTTVQIGAHQISASVLTDKGNTRLVKSYLPLDNKDWHKIAVVFDGKTGRAELYWDGKMVAKKTLPAGAIQDGIRSQDFYIGSPQGDSFSGLVDNVSFLRGALTGQEVIALQGGKTTVSKVLQSYATAPVDEKPPVVVVSEKQDKDTPDEPPETPVVVAPSPQPKPVAEKPKPKAPDEKPAPSKPKPSKQDDDDGVTIIKGTHGRDTVKGTQGDDKITAHNGNDKVSAYSGDDYIHAGAGRDIIGAGNGDDVIVYDKNDISVHGGQGTDTLLVKHGGGSDATRVKIYSVEILDMENDRSNKIELNMKMLRQSSKDLLIIGDENDRVIFNDPIEFRELNTFRQDGDEFTRYEASRHGIKEIVVIDTDVTIEVGDTIL